MRQGQALLCLCESQQEAMRLAKAHCLARMTGPSATAWLRSGVEEWVGTIIDR
jgi:hypothetical protein